MKKHPTDTARQHARVLRATMTDAELKLWRVLSSKQPDGFRFRRQVPMGRFVADFVCHSARLVIEVDGGQHEPEKDAGRTAFLEGEGYRVLRFWNNEVLENIEGAYLTIAEYLRGHSGKLPRS